MRVPTDGPRAGSRIKEGVRRRKEQHRERGKTYRIGFVALAVLVIFAGLALVPLPGPGWLIIAIGIAMLALEFDRAERLLERVLDRLDAAQDSAARAGPVAKAVGAVAVVGGLVAAAVAVVLWDVPLIPG